MLLPLLILAPALPRSVDPSTILESTRYRQRGDSFKVSRRHSGDPGKVYTLTRPVGRPVEYAIEAIKVRTHETLGPREETRY